MGRCVSPKRPRRTVLQVQDRFFTKGGVVTLAAFVTLLMTVGGFGVKIVQTIDATQNTLDEHTKLITRVCLFARAALLLLALLSSPF
jgi:hypothetical protein